MIWYHRFSLIQDLFLMNLRPYFSLVCLLAGWHGLSAQLVHQLPAPFGFDLRGVNAPSADVILIPELDEMDGTWRSADGGATWTQLPYHVSRTCFADDQVGYAFYNRDTLLKTTDAGATWSVIEPTGDFSFGTVNWSVTPQSATRFQMAVYFADEQNGLVADGGGNFGGAGLFQTTDGGQSWSVINAPNFEQAHILNENVIWASREDSIYRSVDGGSTWDNLVSPLPQSNQREPFIRGLDGQTAYFWKGDRFYRSTDGGATWENLSDNIPDNRGIFDAFYYDANTAILLCDSNEPSLEYGPRRSTDGGQTWTSVPITDIGGKIDFRLRNLVVLDDADRTTFLYGRDGLLAKSTDQGETWEMLTVPAMLTLSDIRFFDADQGAATAGEQLFRTSNAGANWDLIEQEVSNLSGDNAFIYPYSSTQAVACNRAFGANFLVQSNDGGQTWSSFRDLSSLSSPFMQTVFADEQAGVILYGAFFTGLDSAALTTDGGQSWTFVDITMPTGLSAFDHLAMVDAANLFASHDGELYASTDGGVSWAEIYSGIPDFESLSFIDASVGYATIGFTVHKTTDGGVTWTDLGQSSAVIHFFDGEHGVAYNDFSFEVYQTSDGGATWTQVGAEYLDPALDNSFDRTLFINAIAMSGPNTFYLAGDETSILSNGPQGQGPSQGTTDLPSSDQALSLRVYPNPSQGRILIDGVAWQPGAVDWQVLDVQGRCLLRGQAEARSVAMSLDLSALPTGLYLLHLQQGSLRASERVWLR